MTAEKYNDGFVVGRLAIGTYVYMYNLYIFSPSYTMYWTSEYYNNTCNRRTCSDPRTNSSVIAFYNDKIIIITIIYIYVSYVLHEYYNSTILNKIYLYTLRCRSASQPMIIIEVTNKL